ncbi:MULTISPECIES: hypothetical protein [unclassified Streptomyces]|nr:MULTISPECIES: hypothetical protein [unclassified Streptomyces]
MDVGPVDTEVVKHHDHVQGEELGAGGPGQRGTPLAEQAFVSRQ